MVRYPIAPREDSENEPLVRMEWLNVELSQRPATIEFRTAGWSGVANWHPIDFKSLQTTLASMGVIPGKRNQRTSPGRTLFGHCARKPSVERSSTAIWIGLLKLSRSTAVIGPRIRGPLRSSILPSMLGRSGVSDMVGSTMAMICRSSRSAEQRVKNWSRWLDRDGRPTRGDLPAGRLTVLDWSARQPS